MPGWRWRTVRVRSLNEKTLTVTNMKIGESTGPNSLRVAGFHKPDTG